MASQEIVFQNKTNLNGLCSQADRARAAFVCRCLNIPDILSAVSIIFDSNLYFINYAQHCSNKDKSFKYKCHNKEYEI